MRTVSISRNDVLKSIYFITAITQKQNSSTMQGSLSSRGDLMGGILDRWINTVPESIVLNRLILSDINTSLNPEVISDYYMYDPRLVGIAPDVIGIRTTNATIPFVVFDEKWKPIESMPQIEVKTFKKPQKMVSLRNQSYEEKYLVLVESEFRIDYLIPFFDMRIFDKEIFNSLNMDNDTFIISNSEKKLKKLNYVEINNDTIGTVTLLKVTTAKEFMKSATLCEGTVSVQRLDNIEKKTRKPTGAKLKIKLDSFCNLNKSGLYTFNENWFDGISNGGIPFYNKTSRGQTSQFLFRPLDIYIENKEAITVIKKSNSSMYIEVSENAKINEFLLEANSIYKIEFSMLDRSSNNGEEYFMQKSLIKYINDYELTLKETLKRIIEGKVSI